MNNIITILASGDLIPHRHRDHKLTGDYLGSRELHIEPDWLLIYRTTTSELILERTGTHADLFR